MAVLSALQTKGGEVMGAEERSRKFSEAQADAQFIYIEAERDLIAEHHLVVQLESDNSSLQSENDALRELVGIMHRYVVKECIGCTHRASGTCDGCAIIGYERRMRELGIGVEE